MDSFELRSRCAVQMAEYIVKNLGSYFKVTWRILSKSPITEVSYLIALPSVSNLSMALRWPLLIFTLALGLAVPQMLAENSNAESELKLGIATYGKAKYSDAIEHLERAVTLNPRTVTGHFYLAESYDGAYSEECDHDCEANE